MTALADYRHDSNGPLNGGWRRAKRSTRTRRHWWSAFRNLFDAVLRPDYFQRVAWLAANNILVETARTGQ